MRKLVSLAFLLGSLLSSMSQDFTNKGKDFWLGYGNHVRMFTGNPAEQMQIYITSDVNTTGVVDIPSIGFNQAYTITANQITTINIPRGAALVNEGLYNHGIHVTAQKPVVVYSFIYVNAVSGATLCLPTATLGKEYFSINYSQISNEPGASYSYFFAIATDTGTTTVQITPAQNTLGGRPAGVPFTVNLTQGQIYQVLSPVDLSGSEIQSINNGSGCKKIAVFNGSGKISIGCVNAGSSDNLYQQMYPTSTWGKVYVTAPSINTANTTGQYNFYRVFKSNPAAIVKLNGAIIPNAVFVNNQYASLPASNEPSIIEADMPIMVAQYFTTQSCSGNGGLGDPEMIYLNPVEQTISKVTLNSMQPVSGTNINQHFINVILKTSAAAINSFNIDGVSYAANFTTHPNATGYSFARIQVNQGTHTLSCDTPFNAIAYGFGANESYGYSAGTNLKDLYQFVSIQNDYGTVNFPAGCKGSPFKFSMTFPYQPTSISWQFNGLFADTTIINPVPDSSWVVSGRTLYRYKLIKTYQINAIGTYPISVIANNPTGGGCSGLQEIEYDLQIFERPIADFTFTHNGCVSDSVAFMDNTNGQSRPVIKWNWDFGDATSSALPSPKHKYNTAGNKTVRYSSLTDVGCLSDTVSKVIPLSDPPVAKFGMSAPFCEKLVITFTDSSTIVTGTIVRWTWNLGDGTIINASNANPIQHTYNTPGTYVVTLEVETATGCRSVLSSQNLVIYNKPVADFGIPSVCLPAGTAPFTDLSSIADGSQNLFTYLWNFGDGNTSTQKNPVHQYTAAGPYNVRLTVTSNNGCVDDSIKVMNTIYPQPKLSVSAPVQKCFGDSVRVAIKINTPAGLKITDYTCNWSNDAPTTGTIAAGADSIIVYHVFTNAGNQSVTVFVRSGTPGTCFSDTVTVPVYINRLPVPNYSIAPVSCAGEVVAFTDLSSSADGTVNKWKWIFGNTLVSSLQNPSTTYASPGTYTSSLQVESNNGCISTVLSKPVVVNYLPQPNFGTPEVCLTDPFAQFTDSSRIGDNSESQFIYLWNFADPNATAGNPNTSTQKNPQHRYTAVGQYTVSLTVTSKDGCKSSISKPFTVNGSIPLAGFNVNNATSLCANQDVTVNDASTVDFGNIVRVEVYWDYGNDPTIKTMDEEPAPGRLYAHKYPDFGTPGTRTFQVRYVAYSGINCINEITKSVTVNASPSIQFDPMNAVCEEVIPFQLSAAREVFGFTGTGIYSGNGIIAPGGLFSPAEAKPGIHTIRYSFTAANGCRTFAEQTITVNPTPLVDAGPDRTVLEGGFITLQAKATGSSLSYSWTPNISIDNIAISTPKVSPKEDLTYTLTVTSVDGCINDDDVFVKVLKTPKIPNVFSPNGDGINDKWVIEYLESYPGATVEVYNRYGQLVYRSVGYSNPWDGTYNGNPMPVATYYWIINPKNGRQQMNGSVTIIR